MDGDTVTDGGCRVAMPADAQDMDRAWIQVGASDAPGGWLVPVDALNDLLRTRGLVIIRRHLLSNLREPCPYGATAVDE